MPYGRRPATLFLMTPRRLPLLSLLAITLIGTIAAAAGSARVAERHTLLPERIYRSEHALATATHDLSLTVAYFTESPWTHSAVVRATRAALEILSQCRLSVRRLDVVRIDAPRRYHYFETAVARELAHAIELAKPTVFFVTDTRAQPAFDAEAIGRSNSQSRPELADTVWITHPTRDVGLALAHELVHVLTDSGTHVDAPNNLMRPETAPEHRKLTTMQCATVRTTGTRNGLLAPR